MAQVTMTVRLEETKGKKFTHLCELNALQNLPTDWDVYGTPAPSTKSVEEVEQLVRLLPVFVLNSVSIEHSEWVGISIRIDNNGEKVSIRILDSGITWYVKDDKGTEFHEEEPCSEKIYRDIVNSISTVA